MLQPGTPPRPSSEWIDRFAAVLNDDLNTPQALAVVHDSVHTGNTALGTGDDGQGQRALHAVGWMTGIFDIVVDTPTVSPWGQR